MQVTMIVRQTGKQASGGTQGPALRGGPLSDLIITRLRGDYAEAASTDVLYHGVLAATTGTIAAGNIVGAGPAAATQFALWNPPGSGYNLEIVKFFMGAISGTPPGGPVFHGLMQGTPAASVASAAGTPGLFGASGSVGRLLASAAGAALTGVANSPVTVRPSSISLFAAAIAAGSNIENTVELVEGDLIVQPGYIWVPLWAGAGTTFLNAYGVSWMEVPVV